MHSHNYVYMWYIGKIIVHVSVAVNVMSTCQLEPRFFLVNARSALSEIDQDRQ